MCVSDLKQGACVCVKTPLVEFCFPPSGAFLWAVDPEDQTDIGRGQQCGCPRPEGQSFPTQLAQKTRTEAFGAGKFRKFTSVPCPFWRIHRAVQGCREGPGRTGVGAGGPWAWGGRGARNRERGRHPTPVRSSTCGSSWKTICVSWRSDPVTGKMNPNTELGVEMFGVEGLGGVSLEPIYGQEAKPWGSVGESC